jgi:hypothetical protein
MSGLKLWLMYSLLIVLAIVGYMMRSAMFLGTVLTIILTLLLWQVLSKLFSKR